VSAAGFFTADENVELAELQISKAITAMESEEAPSIVHAMLAQTRATLALAERQHIANLQRERQHLLSATTGMFADVPALLAQAEELTTRIRTREVGLT